MFVPIFSTNVSNSSLATVPPAVGAVGSLVNLDNAARNIQVTAANPVATLDAHIQAPNNSLVPVRPSQGCQH